MNDWTPEKEEKILKRSKWLLTIKIIRILFVIFVCYAVYMFGMLLFTEKFGAKYEKAYYVQVATSMKYPNVYVEYTNLFGSGVNAFGTETYAQPLLKIVGKEEIVVGDAHVSLRLFKNPSSIHYEHPGRAQLNTFSFVLPNDKHEDDDSQSVWQRLEMLPEGTVAELKFTTTAYMTPETLLEKLSRYEVDALWMPLFTGEFEDFTPTAYGGSGASVSVQDKIGLYGGHAHGEDFRGGQFNRSLNLDTIEESKDMYQTNMQQLLETKHEFLGLSYLQERYDYIQANGFKVYGAVITGPTKELLKLRGEPGVYDVQLGDVELWNWE
ncbi:MAG: anti sigma factor C-terminal domain-containing protein [Solibacillus sp.]